MKKYRQRSYVKAKASLWRKTERCRAYHKKYKSVYQVKLHGLSLEQYHNLLITQLGKCAICSIEMKNPQIDHCHKTGTVRGLLCIRCNLGLSFVENTGYIDKANEYLRREYAVSSLSN